MIDEICENYSKMPAQVAINWLIAQDNVITLLKMSNPKHLEYNLRGLGWMIDDRYVDMLIKYFLIKFERCNVVKLG